MTEKISKEQSSKEIESPDILDVPVTFTSTSTSTDAYSDEIVDASFEAIDISPPVSKLVTTTSVGNGEEVEKLMSQAINLSNTQVYHEPTCLICSSPYREALEKVFVEKQSLKEVVNLFKEKTGAEIGENVVDNHTTHHMSRGVRELQKVEYIHRLKRLNSPNVTTLEKISLAYAIITERLMGVNSLVPTGEESAAKIEQIKSAETNKLMGTLNNLLKLQASIMGEMKTSGELVYIPTNEFVLVFRDALRSAKTAREKELITSLLDKLESLARKTQ